MSDIRATLDMLKPHYLSASERILLSTKGTVQTLLAVIHDTPVKVEVISQLNYDTVLVRWVRLYTDDLNMTTLALAESVIPLAKNRPDFIGKMSDRKLGIGASVARCCDRTGDPGNPRRCPHNRTVVQDHRGQD